MSHVLGVVRRAFLFVIAAAMVVGVQGGLFSRAAAETGTPAAGQAAPATLGKACDQEPLRDAEDAKKLNSSVQCVGGRGFKTRGFLNANCILSDRSLEPGAVYQLGECKGDKTFQGEAIAQTRVIARLNQTWQAEHPGSVKPDIQWELRVPGVVNNITQATYTGRTDLVTYDPTTADTPVSFAEVKGDWNGTMDAASRQLRDYTDAIGTTMPDRRPIAMDFSTDPISDSFEVTSCNRTDVSDPHVEVYTTTSDSGFPGVIKVTRKRLECGTRTPTPNHTVDEAGESDGITVTAGEDQNNNGNDDFLDELRKYANAHGERNLAQNVPTGVVVTFKEPVPIFLTGKQADHVLKLFSVPALVSAGAAAIQAVGRRLLDGLNSGALGDTAGLTSDLGAGGNSALTAEIESFLSDAGAIGTENLEVLANIAKGVTISPDALQTAAGRVATTIASAAGEDSTVVTAQTTAVLENMTVGEDAVAAIAGEDMSVAAGELLQGVLAFVASDEAVAFVGAVFAGSVIGLLVVGVVLGVLWGLSQWNVFGDPHLVTLDGLAYDMQTIGEFHLLTVPSLGVDIQARYTKFNGSNSISGLDRIAFNAGDSWVELTHDGHAYVDGDQLGSGMNEVNLGGGAELYRNDGSYAVEFVNADATADEPDPAASMSLTFRGTQFAAQVPAGVPTSGLLGDHDGNPGNDLQYPDGTAVAGRSASTIDGPFADAWRVTDADSKVWYQPGESTASFTDESFPANVVTLADYDPAVLNAAAATCSSKGVPAGPQFQACMLDVAETGDSSYATTAAAVTDFLTSPTASTVDANGDLTEDFEGTIPANLRPASTWSVGGSIAAGPVFDGSGYNFSIPSLPHRLQTSVAFDLDAVGVTPGTQDDQSATISIDRMTPVKVSFTPTSATVVSGPGTVTAISNGTTPAGDPLQRYRVVIQGEDPAAQLRAAIVPNGFRGVLGTSLAVDNIAVHVEAVAPQQFPLELGQTVRADQPSPGAGTLENAASHDLYSFDVDAAHANDYLIWNTCPAGISWTLTNSSGRNSANRRV